MPKTKGFSFTFYFFFFSGYGSFVAMSMLMSEECQQMAFVFLSFSFRWQNSITEPDILDWVSTKMQEELTIYKREILGLDAKEVSVGMQGGW